MEKMLLSEIARACHGSLYNSNQNISISNISTDSRTIESGDLFIPIKGEIYDGHGFIAQAIQQGASAILTQVALEGKNIPYILVKDTLVAMHLIAKHYKEKFQIPYIAITGSSGKTTTKEMIASVLAQKYSVHKNEGNLNNTIGLPITIFKLKNTHQIAVLEMGMNVFGEIKTLVDMVHPETAVITNVGTAHIEYLGSREGILKAKCEIFTHFTKENTAILNGDNDMLNTISANKFKIKRYSIQEESELKGIHIEDKGLEGMSFGVEIHGKEEAFFVPLPGIHNVYNALSAIAIGLQYGVEICAIREGLLNFKSGKMRMDIFDTQNQMKIINDVYNANPDSMKVTLDVLCNTKENRRSVCILGDMRELGKTSQEAHLQLGAYVVERKVDVLVTMGQCAKDIAKGAKDAGMDVKNIYTYESNEEVIANIDKILKPKDIVLVKGSRGMFMEKIIEIWKK